MAVIYTIGHSTRTFDELVAALRKHGIVTLVDIRAFPLSRRQPHFNRESLEVELPRCGIRYVWMRELGGRRKKVLKESPNTGLRNDSFRNYADYMMTEEFAEGIGRLLEIASRSDLILPSPRADDKGGAPRSGTAIMCAERMCFQCHRMLVSDYLVAHGHSVLHIDDEKQTPRKHTLMAEAQLVEGKLLYDGGRLL
ncbi:MAG TPA: DUF488 domain-containing protein [Candidatus Binatia bacterium]|nr:DUF488 domain-containing protein [Candidatus Binatia bacterium]